MSYNLTLTKKEIEYIIDNLMYIVSCSKEGNKKIKIITKLQKLLKPIKIRSAKNKGRNLQKWVCERIAQLFNIEYNQQDDNCSIHSREMGQTGIDIIIRNKIKENFPFIIECKSGEQLKLINSIQQVKKNTPDNNWWIIVYKKKAFKNPIVIMDWHCFYWLNSERLNKLK